MSASDVLIHGAAGTPMGGSQGSLARVPAAQLGGVAAAPALERSRVPAEGVDALIIEMRPGARLGHGQVVDPMFLDGPEDACGCGEDGSGRLTGSFAEDCATAFRFTPEAQDGYVAALLLKPQANGARARIVGDATHAQAPGDFPTAPVAATGKRLPKIGRDKDDVDPREVSEAFAVPMALMQTVCIGGGEGAAIAVEPV